jgi:hypothetical protein
LKCTGVAHETIFEKMIAPNLVKKQGYYENKPCMYGLLTEIVKPAPFKAYPSGANPQPLAKQ